MSFAADNVCIVPVTEEHTTGLQLCLVAVHVELGEQAFVTAPRPDDTLGWIRHSLFTGDPHFVALAGDEIIGWCDVRRREEAGHGNVGLLGIGVRYEWRRHSVGTRLLQAALAAAQRSGFTSIEVEVAPSNSTATGFYQRMGFAYESTHSATGLVHWQMLL